MKSDNNILRQKLIKKHSYYVNYCNAMKNYSDFLLSKKEVESGKHENTALISSALVKAFNSKRGKPYFSSDGEIKEVIRGRETIEEYKASILKFGCVKATPHNSKEEEIQINYYYNAFVYAMTRIISLVLFFDDKEDKKKWDKEYTHVKKSIDYLEQISQELYGNDFRISPKWQYIKELGNIKRDKPVVYFGAQHIFTHYYLKTNPTIEEMLGWMDIADGILKREREFDPNQEREKAEEEKRKKKEESQKKLQRKEEKKEKEKQREFEYNKQLKQANYILLLFFTVLTVFVSYLYQNDGRMEKETLENIQNMAVFVLIPLIYFIYYYTYRYNYTHADKEDKTTEIKNIIKGSYTKKEKLKIFVIALVLAITITFGYIVIFYLIVALITFFGIYRAYKANQKINVDRDLFKEYENTKAKIEESMKISQSNIDAPFYGFTKVSDNVINEIYHFFKDKKTEIEISMRTVKDSDIPYDEMDTENLYYVVEKSKEYDKLEKDGFSELQKIKAYGSVLERI